MTRGENLAGIDAKGDSLISDELINKYVEREKESLTQPLENGKPEFLTFKDLKAIEKGGYKVIGTGFCKDSEHHLWKIEKEGDEFKLLRAVEDEDVNIEKKQVVGLKEAPSFHSVIVSPGTYQTIEYSDDIPSYSQEVRVLDDAEQAVVYDYDRLLGIFNVELEDGTIIEVAESDVEWEEESEKDLTKERKKKESAKMTPEARDFVSKKIKKLIEEGYEHDQASAIAYDMARDKGYDVGKVEGNQKKLGRDWKLKIDVKDVWQEAEEADMSDEVEFKDIRNKILRILHSYSSKIGKKLGDDVEQDYFEILVNLENSDDVDEFD